MRQFQISNFKLTLVAVIILLALRGAVFAAGDYGSEAVFSAGTGVRAMSMGSAFSALADDSSAVMWNPAGLENLEKQEISLLHYPMYESTYYNSITYGYPVLDVGSFGAAVYRVFTDSIAVYDSGDVSGGTTSLEQYRITAAYARKISPEFAAGFSVNAYNFSMLNVNAFGIGADAGVIYRPFGFLALSATIQNLMNPSLMMRESEEEFPRVYTLGCLLNFGENPFRLNITSDFSAGAGEYPVIRAGLEAVFLGIASLRAGYNGGEICFGAGISYLGASIDYGYRVNEYLGGLSRLSVSYSFGLTRQEQAEERQKALKEQVKKLIEEEFRKKENEKARALYEEALSLNADGRQEEALGALEKAFEWNENYEDAKKLKARIVSGLVGRYYERGVGAYRDANFISALENFKKVSEIDGNYKDTQEYMKKLETRLAVGEKAKEFFSKGVEYYINKRYSEALESLNKAQKADPKNELIRQYIAKARAQQASEKGGRKITAEQAGQVTKLYYAGLKSYTAGDLKAALSVWKEALAINPEDIKIMKSIEKAQAEQAELQKRGIK
ncbi:MAG TPA: UPF0164 family protein [Candidatus Goldiibacteriota bacterium]|nr:UPF0164 family protein [Candidatus Goldiibacteriota bacterium]